MDNINLIIGNNLNTYRKSKGYSLDKVSEMTGVSKGMLAQIEKGETNPSISTLWKIANGLHISSTFLLEAEPDDLVIIKKNEFTPITEGNDKLSVFPTFAFDFNKKFEVLVVDLEVGCVHCSEPHENGAEEYIYVSKGDFELTIQGNSYNLNEGDSIKFLADKSHEYRNNSKELCRLHIIIYYNNAR
ncbi:helix-turn-helix domain-containing protein [Clostridium lacusfryxellense]|uniref:helix-turn-helix domain-containing protein n=1 Tax=Clostridium lacusfryxellense TaxID=205328 RepID=UPI001C0E4CFD|nr:helix-turn-helix domain-containing protein [Clostridium lacusfryxellense]MBU3111302.1 helix-turn-helix domain-containing protein [Clostridium lacusfryxellense]